MRMNSNGEMSVQVQCTPGPDPLEEVVRIPGRRSRRRQDGQGTSLDLETAPPCSTR